MLQIDQGLSIDWTFELQFALVEDPTDIPLKANFGQTIEFVGVEGTHDCIVTEYVLDDSISANYFTDFFEVFVPVTPQEPEPEPEEEIVEPEPEESEE